MFAPPIAKAQTQPAHAVTRRPAPQASPRILGNQSALRRAGQHARGAVQAKLAIGRSDDPMEHDADRVADQVMRMPEPDAAGALAPHQPAGRRLLAHELAHTARQDAAPRAVRRQPQPAAQTQPQQIEAARAAAWGRVFSALQTVQGIGPPAPPGREDRSADMRDQARRLAVQLFGWDPPNMEQIADILGQMGQALMPGLKTTTAAANDKECGSRAAYVVGHTPPVVLCPTFFSSTAEEKTRTMVHESAHIAGIGQPSGESYCGVYDCQTNCGGFSSADAWSHYVHCLSGQTADKPTQITAPASPGGGGHP